MSNRKAVARTPITVDDRCEEPRTLDRARCRQVREAEVGPEVWEQGAARWC